MSKKHTRKLLYFQVFKENLSLLYKQHKFKFTFLGFTLKRLKRFRNLNVSKIMFLFIYFTLQVDNIEQITKQEKSLLSLSLFYFSCCTLSPFAVGYVWYLDSFSVCGKALWWDDKVKEVKWFYKTCLLPIFLFKLAENFQTFT